MLPLRSAALWQRLLRLGFRDFDFCDQGHIHQSYSVATGGEDDEGSSVGSEVCEIPRRHVARPAISETNCKGPERSRLKVFFEDFFGHTEIRSFPI